MAAMIGASPWMKKATVLTYTRISDMQQSKDDRKKSAAKKNLLYYSSTTMSRKV